MTPHIKFTTNGKIWRHKGKLRPEIKKRKNYPLFALYDIARELDVNYKDQNQDGYQGYLRRTRNVLTHEYLILHFKDHNWSTEVDDKSLHMFIADFVDQTLELLKLVRSAIIYLIAFIDLNERRKYKKSDEIIAPMFLPKFDPSIYSASKIFKKY